MNSWYEAFRSHAERSPEAIAVVSDAGFAITYGSLEASTNRLANFLLGQGSGRGQVLSLLIGDPVAMLEAVSASLKAGCAFMPFDPATPDPRLRSMLKVAEPQFFLADDANRERAARLVGEAAPACKLLSPAAVQGASSPPASDSAPDDLAYLYFTSGSTGDPKAIAGRLKGLLHFIEWEVEELGLDADTRVAQLTSPGFDAYLRDVLTPLAAGGTVCVPADRNLLLYQARLVRWLEDQEVTLLHCVPSLLRSLLNSALAPESLPRLRQVLVAGEPLLPSDVRRFFELFGDRIALLNLYGPTETTMIKLVHRVRRADAERPSVPIGQPIRGARAMVFDDRGRPSNTGMIGEIYIRTPFRSLGYYRRPDLTAASFVRNPLSENPEDILYKTGDLGRVLEDGNFEFLGRRDRQVKIRGVRIELAEVESVLREHDSVRDLAVIDRDDPELGRSLCAYVVLSPEVESEELLAWMGRSLPPAMLPSQFISLPVIPRLVNGKLDRAALPDPRQALARQQVPFVAPRTPIEQALAAIWQDLLQIGPPGIHQSFFTVGGHSLLAMQVLSRVEAAFGVEVPLQDFLTAPTVHGLAEKLEATILARSAEGDDLLDLLESLDEEEAASLAAPAPRAEVVHGTAGRGDDDA